MDKIHPEFLKARDVLGHHPVDIGGVAAGLADQGGGPSF